MRRFVDPWLKWMKEKSIAFFIQKCSLHYTSEGQDEASQKGEKINDYT